MSAEDEGSGMLELQVVDPAWLLQANPPVDNVDPGPGLIASGVGAFLTTLVVGGILLALAEAYTVRTIASVLDNPVESFGYGIVALLALVLLTVLLVITIIGILVAVPLLLVAFVIWAVGAAVAYLAIADRIVGHEDGWLKPLLLAAGISGALAVTGIGGIIAFAVGATGFGAILRGWLA